VHTCNISFRIGLLYSKAYSVTASLPLHSSPETTLRFELEYDWELLVDVSGRMQRADAEQSSSWRKARVGLSWNAQFEDLRNYMGAAWYRNTFELPAFRDTRHVLLKFGAVDYFCEVFLNGLFLGTHEGGYTPFSFEITSAVHAGNNQLMIRVIDPPMDEAQNRDLFPEMMYNEIPHGKQNWYVQNSGIWQGVRLELCPALYIERLDVTAKVTGEFEISARLAGIGLTADNGSLVSQTRLEADIYDSSSRHVFSIQHELDSTSHVVHLKGELPNARKWSPDQPSVYVLVASLSGPVQYRRQTRFGFRSFEARDGKLYLNGNPFYMFAALDQDFYPETVHTPTSQEFVRDMMVKAKRLGINVLRCHLKVAHPVYLDVADEVGMLIWAELPSWSDCWFPSDHFSTMAAVRAEKMFWEILIRDWNHPCIVLQTIMNESWGINLKDAAQRAWLCSTFDGFKAMLAPLGRLVVDNSACEGNFHVKTDIEDFHQYYSMPDQVKKWDKWLAEFAARPAWTFSPYGDAQRTGKEPLLVSEFGNWGLPILPDELPWWFEVSFGDREVTRPAGVLDRFRAFGFDKMFDSFNELAEETQWHQFISLKYEIESIRSYESLQGYVITGITDVHWEVNGLMDMWRNDKVYARDLSMIQQPDLVICKLPTHCVEGGQSMSVPTLMSHYGSADLRGARVRWSTSWGAGGHFLIASDQEPGTVLALQEIEFTVPETDSLTTEYLELEVRSRSGHRICENGYELFVLPTASPAREVSIFLHGDDWDDLSSQLEITGYNIAKALDPSALLVTRAYDEVVATHVENGGSVLLLVNSKDALPPEWPLTISARAGNELDGRWFSNFNWMRRDREPFAGIAFNRLLGFESAQVAPDFVVENVAPEHFDDVLSGITLGWLNRNSALTLQVQVRQGKMLISTYKTESYGSDPFATHLLDCLIRYMGRGACQPRLRISLSATAGVS
jgi:hypothetical protein